MAGVVKKLIVFVLVIAVLAAAGYGAFRLYNYVVQDVTSRVKKGVSEGVSGGIVDAVNPLKWPKKLLGE